MSSIRSDTSIPGRPASGARRNLVTEHAILDAARGLLHERGFGAFSIDEVAKRARAGKPTIYRWWPTRADLLAAVYAGERALRVPEPDTGRLADDLKEFARLLSDGWRSGAGGEALRGLIAESMASEGARPALAATVGEALTRPLGLMVARAGRRREIDPADSEVLVELWSSLLINGLLAGDDARRATSSRAARLLASGRGRKPGASR